MNKLKFIFIFISIFFVQNIFSQKTPYLDLTKSKDLLTAYVKVRGSLDSADESVVYDEGLIYAVIPNQPIKLLFKLQMYNISKFIETDSTYNLITREMLVYEDPKTGEIIEKWYNPFIKDSVNVVHVWNDPVNNKSYKDDFSIPFVKLDNNRMCFYIDVPLFYPSPLKAAEWPENSRSDMYQAAELFQFFVSEKDLQNKKLKAIPFDIAWTRFSDFLPWMRMGNKPGMLMYSSRGTKLMGGYNALPTKIKDYVTKNNPIYAHPPATYVTPNMTSWKYFKQLKGKK